MKGDQKASLERRRSGSLASTTSGGGGGSAKRAKRQPKAAGDDLADGPEWWVSRRFNEQALCTFAGAPCACQAISGVCSSSCWPCPRVSCHEPLHSLELCHAITSSGLCAHPRRADHHGCTVLRMAAGQASRSVLARLEQRQPMGWLQQGTACGTSSPCSPCPPSPT
jgi:hypothetical protein